MMFKVARYDVFQTVIESSPRSASYSSRGQIEKKGYLTSDRRGKTLRSSMRVLW